MASNQNVTKGWGWGIKTAKLVYVNLQGAYSNLCHLYVCVMSKVFNLKNALERNTVFFKLRI